MKNFLLGIVVSFVGMVGYGVALKYGYVDGIKDKPEFNECINQAKIGNGSRYDCAKLELEVSENK